MSKLETALETALQRQTFIKQVQDVVGHYKVHSELVGENFAVYIKWFDPLQNETLILALWADGWFELGYYSSDHLDGFGTAKEGFALFEAKRYEQIELYRRKILRERKERLQQVTV